MSEEDIASFIEAMAGTTPSPGLVHQAYYQTEGNPLFVAEIVRLLVQEGEVGTRHTVFLQEADHWSIGIPEGVREVIGRRLNRLSQECNDTLTLAAIIGREFGLDQLRTVTENLSENKLLEVLESAMAVQVIEELPASRERYQFTHALIQETLANELSATRRIRVHARIAEALEELYGGRAQEHAAELAFHFAEAVTVTGTDKLVKYSLIAGEQALASYAYREALSLFQRAISAQGANPGSPALDAETADLLYGLGRAQVATLPIYQLHEAVTSLRGAFDYYIDTGDLSQAVAIAEHPFPPVRLIGLRQVEG